MAILSACTTPTFSPKPDVSTQIGDDIDPQNETALPSSEKNGGAEPAAEFDSVEDAIREIGAIIKNGPDQFIHPNDYKLYEKDYVCFLEEDTFFVMFERKCVMLTLSGTSILYQTEDYSKHALFYWNQGYDQEQYATERIHRFNLAQYGDTEFFFGELYGNIEIMWWDDGDEFGIEYPAEIGITPGDIINQIRVVKYELD